MLTMYHSCVISVNFNFVLHSFGGQVYMWRLEYNLWKSVLFFPNMGFQAPNSDCQSWWQTTIPTEPFCWSGANFD